jgi:acyl-CoA-binding protein
VAVNHYILYTPNCYKHKAYKQYKGHNSNKSREKYLGIKHLCRKETKLAYQNYLEDKLNINNNISQEHEQTQTRPNTKKLYSLLKHSKQDSFGENTFIFF